ANVGERAVAVIVVERGRLAVIIVRMAVAAHAGAVITAPEIALGGPVDIVCDHKIEATVVVVIEPGRAGGPPSGIGNSGALSYVGKRAVAIIVVENGTVVSEDEQVRESIVVIVPYRNAHTEQPLSPNARLFSDIGKRAIAIVAVKGAAEGVFGSVKPSRRTVHEIQVKQAVLVVVDPAAARAHGLDQVFFSRGRVVVLKRDPGGTRHVEKCDWILIWSVRGRERCRDERGTH